MPNPKSGGDSANPKRRAGANPKRRAGAGDDPDPKRRASASAGDDPDPERRAGAGDDPDPKRRASAGDDPDPERRAGAGDDPDPERRAGDDPDPDPERRSGAGDDPDPERRAGDVRQPKRRRGDAPDGTNPKRFPEGGDPFGKRTATAFSGVAEGRSTEGEVEKVYPQKEVAMDITERKQQIETICLQMQETASFLTKIKASQTALEREDISNHISVLCDNLSKFRTLLVEIGFDAHESATKHVNDLMATYADHMQETISKNEKIRIRNKGQLIPFQEPGEYMHEYYRLRPHQEEEEETKLTRYLKKQIASEESLYSNYRKGRKGLLAGCTFEAKSMISPMHFTHCTPGVAIEDNLAATTGTSLQIFSFKIDNKIKGNLNWPLYVYGVVAARDKVDFNRNILFNRMRNNAQKVTEADPILRLTGPARAILPELHFEVELMVKGRTKSRDRALINLAYPYTLCCAGLHTIDIQNCLCEIKLSLEHLVNSVQATIIGVRIVKAGPCTFKYGCRVACSSKHHEVSITDNKGSVESVTDPPDTQVVLLDSHYCDGGEMPMGNDGYLDLTRRVVSVELQANHVYYPEKFEETFKVLIEACSESGGVAAQGHVMLTPKLCNISQAVCDIGDSQVEITVAWSVHVVSKSLL